MIVEGLALAGLTSLGFYFLFAKLPERVQKFLLKHPLLTDAVACVGTYALFGGSLTALFASAWVCVAVSAMLALMNNETTAKMISATANKIKEFKNSALAQLSEKYE